MANLKRESHFMSWGEFLDAATNRKLAPCVACETNPSSRRKYRQEFTGTETYEEALNLAIAGWPEGSARAAEIADSLFDGISQLVERTDLVYDYEGTDFDMGLYLKGEPECWYKFQTHIEEQQGTRQLRLVFNIAASAGVSKETMTAKGATVAALVQLLEFSGYRVEVMLAAGVKSVRGGSFYYDDVLLKAADQPLDIDKLMFAVGHPASLRRLMFSYWESDENQMKENSFSFGYPEDVPQDMRGDIYIAKSYYGEPQWTSTETAKSWVLAQLEKQGIKVRTKSAE